jgi:hypothetical protein
VRILLYDRKCEHDLDGADFVADETFRMFALSVPFPIVRRMLASNLMQRLCRITSLIIQ